MLTPPKRLTDLSAAYAGSWYTIRGTGGDLAEWTEGYEKMLAEHQIGTPLYWYSTLGAHVNDYAIRDGHSVDPLDLFEPDLPFLLFPLEGLVVGRLALFRLAAEDKWFDDMIDNMRRWL